MKIDTKYHGKIEVKEEEFLVFEQGIPGFSEEKQFVLLPFPENEWFEILQSTTTPQIGFVVTNPFLFFKEYDFELDENSLSLLGSPSEKDIKVLSVLTIKDSLKDSTANLQAPVIINLKNNKSKQVILNNSTYQTKHLIFAQPEHTGQKG